MVLIITRNEHGVVLLVQGHARHGNVVFGVAVLGALAAGLDVSVAAETFNWARCDKMVSYQGEASELGAPGGWSL